MLEREIVSVDLREIRPEDAEVCGAICYEAFKSVAEAHGFPPDFPDAPTAIKMLARMIASPGFRGVVAEADGRIVGSNFLDERDPISGLGPITVDPAGQNAGVGRALMQHMLDRAEQRGATGVRLFQSAYHNRSLSLYAKLGFDAREPLSVMVGPPFEASIDGCSVREAVEGDVETCNAVCRKVLGVERGGELSDAVRWGHPIVVEREGRVVGYATTLGSAGHAVGETNADLMALIGSGRPIRGSGIMLPTRNAELFRWCLENGLRVSFPGTLMSTGEYADPQGAFLPSSLY